MVPVLRIVMPTANVTDTERQNTIVRGLNSDYITEDPTENKSVPVEALYAARMDARGVVTIVRTRQAGITAEHTYAGWVLPA